MDPMRALARELVRRGHRATFLHMPDAGALVGDEALGFRPVGRDTHPPGHLAAVVCRMARIDGVLGLRGVIRDVAEATAMLCRELPGALRAVGADMVCCDGTEAAGALVAAHLGLPVVTVANALPLNREPGLPPPFTGWRYDPSRWGRERNLGGYRVSDWLMGAHRRIISAQAERWRLGPRRTVADCLSPLAQVSQTVAGFDFPRREPPETFHHVGPIRDPAGSDAAGGGFAWPERDGRPLAYASLGTLQGGRTALFRRIAAAADRAGFQLVLAHGGRMSGRDADRLPGRPSVHAFVPQAAVLAAADLAILNGGLNTVMDALAAGVPIVAVPIAFEQAAIAARIERSGAGRAVSRRLPGAGRLTRAIERVGHDPAYRAAAAGLRAEIRVAGGLAQAADIVERVLATGRPVTREDAARLTAARARAAGPPAERAA